MADGRCWSETCHWSAEVMLAGSIRLARSQVKAVALSLLRPHRTSMRRRASMLARRRERQAWADTHRPECMERRAFRTKTRR